MSDERLVEKVRGGDLDAFGQLVRRYQGLVFGVAFHALGDVEDARDVAQDAFYRAFVRLDQLRDANRLGSWLRQIALSEVRAQRGRLFRTVPLDGLDLPTDPQYQQDNRILLADALRAIDERSRLTVVLYYLQGHSIAEVGAFLEEPSTTIKSRLRNARAKLRRELESALERNLNETTLPQDFAERITTLLAALRERNERKVKQMLESDPGLVAAREEDTLFTPLHIAAASGDTALVELLLAHGADPNALDRGDNASPLHHAAERNRLGVVKLLVEAGADVNWNFDLHQRGPLGWAVTFDPKNVEVAEYLISKGAKLDIFSAIALGRFDAVREMVTTEPRLLRQRMSQFEYFRSPIEFAGQCRQHGIAKMLAESGTDLTLADAAALGRTDLVERRLEEQPDSEARDVALRSAAFAGQLGTAQQLLKAGADPNYAPEGTSLLFTSLAQLDEAMLRMLIEHGADLEFRDGQWKSTPLGWEVFFGRPEGTQLAIKLGAKVSENLAGLAEAGERGELRRWSAGTAEGYRRVGEIVRNAGRAG